MPRRDVWTVSAMQNCRVVVAAPSEYIPQRVLSEPVSVTGVAVGKAVNAMAYRHYPRIPSAAGHARGIKVSRSAHSSRGAAGCGRIAATESFRNDPMTHARACCYRLSPFRLWTNATPFPGLAQFRRLPPAAPQNNTRTAHDKTMARRINELSKFSLGLGSAVHRYDAAVQVRSI